MTYANNGGFVQAPSLPHAVTAAVLRNAYLTHAEPSRRKQPESSADRMSVNLSSARVRTALAYIEGLQNGQELGALLGYQLERGLHEGHPGVELDAFIYTLRARFPLISRKLTPHPTDGPAEVLEARNVVNGYDLLDFVKGKQYHQYRLRRPAIQNGPGSPERSDQAGAIEAEVEPAARFDGCHRRPAARRGRPPGRAGQLRARAWRRAGAHRRRAAAASGRHSDAAHGQVADPSRGAVPGARGDRGMERSR